MLHRLLGKMYWLSNLPDEVPHGYILVGLRAQGGADGSGGALKTELKKIWLDLLSTQRSDPFRRLHGEMHWLSMVLLPREVNSHLLLRFRAEGCACSSGGALRRVALSITFREDFGEAK